MMDSGACTTDEVVYSEDEAEDQADERDAVDVEHLVSMHKRVGAPVTSVATRKGVKRVLSLNNS